MTLEAAITPSELPHIAATDVFYVFKIQVEDDDDDDDGDDDDDDDDDYAA